MFSIVIPASVTVTSPNGGELWETGSSHDITWTGSGTVGNVKIEFTTTNGSTWTIIAASTANDGSYNWAIPDNPGLESDTCRVRITGIDGYPTDTSDGLFSLVLPPGIFVTSPNGGESWEVGDYHVITWNSQGIVGNVAIDYSVNNGTSWNTIISVTANDGSFNWMVPDDASGTCRVRVRETGGDPADTSDGAFSIVLPAHIKLLVPNGGETWAAGSSREITWTGPGIYGHIKIEYSINNGDSWILITSSTADDGNYSWTVPDTPSESCLVRIDGAFSDTDPPDTSDSVFTITSDTLICGETWLNSNYSAGTVFNGITYGNPLYAAVGNNGVIMTGADGISWTSQNTNTSNDLHGAAFGNNTFVVVGKGGVILTGTTGTTWTPQTSNTTSGLMGITYGGNQFITVGVSGAILTSPDGNAWTNHSPGISNTLYAIAYGNNTYIAAGSGGVILSSPDGSNWTGRVSGTSNTLYGITYGTNQFVAVGGSGTILTSTNGTDWTARTSAVTTALRGAASGGSGSIFVIVGDYGEILTGIDGMNWTAQSSGTGNHLRGVTYGNSQFMVVGEGKIIYTACGPLTPAVTLTSPNGGENWGVGFVHDITWTSTGNVGNLKIEYSINSGINWTVIASSTPNDGIYQWTVPNDPSFTCLVRVSETDGSPLDVSDAVFSIITEPEPTLTLTSPNGGETLNSGDIHTITWSSTGTVGNVLLEYSPDSGANWTIITSSTLNDGSFDWTLPFISSSSDRCLVRISEADEDRKPSDISDAEFTIVSPEIDSLTITSPNGREVLTAGSNHDITWTGTGTVGNIKIEYSINSGDSWAVIKDSTENDGGFSWTVPDTVSDHCLVRISENDEDGTPVDTSDAEFSIISFTSASLTLTYPNGGEQLPVGSVQVITWKSTGEMGEISLEYSTDNGVNWTGIVSSTANSGTYDWTIPDAISGTCLVRIGEVSGTLSDTSDRVFSIIEQSSIIVISPHGGEVWEAGSVYPVTWQTGGDVGNVTIDYSIDNGVNWFTVISSTPNDGSYDWTVPDTPSETCLVRIKGSTDAIVPGISEAVFSIVSPANPVLTVTYPDGGETLVVGNSYEITWSSYGAVGEIKIEYSVDSGTNWTEITAAAENSGRFDWTVPDTVSNTCLVQISDIDGDPIDISDAVFEIAADPGPFITVTSPNGGETLTAGSIHDITWTGTGTIDFVTIDYSTDNGSSWVNIVTAAENSGAYNWTVPAALSDECLVRIGQYNDAGDSEPSDISDAIFSIVSDTAALTVISPNGGECWEADTIQPITWTDTGSIDSITIDYSTDNGSTWFTIAVNETNDGSFDWVLPDTLSDECLVRIRAGSGDDDEAPADTSDDVFQIIPDTSPCGGSWYGSGYSGSFTLTSVTYGNSIFIAVGTGGVILTGANAKTWTSQASGTTNDLHGVIYGDSDNLFVAVGAEGIILTSSNGTTWATAFSPTFRTLRAIAYGAGTFIAVGDSGTILTSANGTDWIDQSPAYTNTLYGIVYGNNQFVAVGSGGIILTGPDGESWAMQESGTVQTLRGITYGSNQFVAVGDSGTIVISSNGINWNTRTAAITSDLLDAAYGNSTFVIVGEEGKILTGSGTGAWNRRASKIRNDLYGAVYGNLRFVAVGLSEIIYSMCEQSSAAANVFNNQKFLRGPGAVFSKRGRRPQPHARHGHFLTLKTYSQIFVFFASFYRILVKRTFKYVRKIQISTFRPWIFCDGDTRTRKGKKTLMTSKPKWEGDSRAVGRWFPGRGKIVPDPWERVPGPWEDDS